jgi:hypothetical protein
LRRPPHVHPGERRVWGPVPVRAMQTPSHTLREQRSQDLRLRFRYQIRMVWCVDRMCCACGGEELILGFFGSNRGSNAVRLAPSTSAFPVGSWPRGCTPRDSGSYRNQQGSRQARGKGALRGDLYAGHPASKLAADLMDKRSAASGNAAVLSPERKRPALKKVENGCEGWHFGPIRRS